MFFAQLTADEIRDLNKEHLVVLFPVGAIEQHGPHLPVDTDARIVEAIAKKMESKSPEKIVVLPTFSYGVVGTRPGSLDIDYRPFEQAVLGISKSALDQGFKKIFFLNGHGGNQNYFEEIVSSLNVDYPYAATIPLYLSGKRGAQALRRVGYKYWIRHADEIETSLILAIDEKLVHKDKIVDEIGPLKTKDYKPFDEGTLKLFLPWEYESKTGVFGEPSRATKEIGEILLDEAAEELLDLVIQFEKITKKIEKIEADKLSNENALINTPEISVDKPVGNNPV